MQFDNEGSGQSMGERVRWARYHRRLEGGDFSLEANTETVPEAGYFYLLRAGAVLLRSEDFAEAQTAYLGLCREHWEQHLGSTSREGRMASAWGLLSLSADDPAAMAVIEQDGLPADRARLEANRRKRIYLERKARMAQNRRGGAPK
jgi:hypothetical protein